MDADAKSGKNRFGVLRAKERAMRTSVKEKDAGINAVLVKIRRETDHRGRRVDFVFMDPTKGLYFTSANPRRRPGSLRCENWFATVKIVLWPTGEEKGI